MEFRKIEDGDRSHRLFLYKLAFSGNLTKCDFMCFASLLHDIQSRLRAGKHRPVAQLSLRDVGDYSISQVEPEISTLSNVPQDSKFILLLGHLILVH